MGFDLIQKYQANKVIRDQNRQGDADLTLAAGGIKEMEMESRNALKSSRTTSVAFKRSLQAKKNQEEGYSYPLGQQETSSRRTGNGTDEEQVELVERG